MTQTLFSNHQKNKNAPGGRNFQLEFESRLEHSRSMIIASGYFGASTIVLYEDKIVELGKKGQCKILIGMVFHAGVTSKQKDALYSLDEKLRDNNSDNGVFISRREYHGKIYSFNNEEANDNALYLGSSNFSTQGLASRNECTALINNPHTKKEISEYLEHIFNSELSTPLSEIDLKIRGVGSTVTPPSNFLEDYIIPLEEFPSESDLEGVCNVTLRVDDQPASSLNLYFDKGRKNANGLYSPRPWYEIEITAGKMERETPYYPKSKLTSPDGNSRSGNFTAYAKDDGLHYKFEMVVSSANGKAISTAKESGGRETLGKFIKGKLERAGVLKEGERVTTEVLDAYGNSSIALKKIDDERYILEFDSPLLDSDKH